MDIFWDSVARYNQATWIAQCIWLLLAGGSVWSLYRHDTPRVRAAARLFMAVSCLWIAVVYFLIYGSARMYHTVEALLWIMLGALWVYDIFDPHASSDRPAKGKPLAVALLLAPLAYPGLSLLLGKHWPDITAPLMPCSLAVFMIGLLLAFRERVNLVLMMLLCHWMLLGIAKTTVFALPEDYIMVIATLPALWEFFSAYIRKASSRGDLKPSGRTMRIVLLIVFLLTVILCIIPSGGSVNQ